MHIVIIPNGLQKDYIVNLVNNLVNIADKLDVIGSDMFSENDFSHKVRYYNMRGSHDEKSSVIEKVRRFLKYYFTLYRFLLKEKPDCIHIQWIRFSFLDGILFHLLLRLSGQKLVYTAHDIVPHDRETLVNKALFYFVYRISHQIVVHTEYLKNRIIKEFKISGKRVHVIHHGVYDIKEYYTRDFAREKLGIQSTDHLFLFFGNIRRYKGLHLLLEAYSELSDKHEGLSLAIAGKIWEPYREECLQLLSGYDNYKIIKKLGFIPEEELSYYFYSSNVVVLPYLEASQSGVMFMAYAHGIPVIVPDLGGFANDVVPGKTGLLFKPGDVRSLYNVMERSIREFNPERFDNGIVKKFADNHYSWAATAEALNKLYANM